MTLMPDRSFVTRFWLMSCRDSWKFLMISYRRRLAKHTAELWPSPSSLSNGGVEFLSCLAATSKHRTGSYKRALISAKAPNPHSSIPPPLFPVLGDGLGDSVLPERKKNKPKCMFPSSVCVSLNFFNKAGFLFCFVFFNSGKVRMHRCAPGRNKKGSKDLKTCLNIDITANHDSWLQLYRFFSVIL